MLYNFLTTLAAASLALAATPTSFTPGSNNPLVVSYSGRTALNGVVIAQNAVSTMPQIGTQTRLNGTSYAVLMIDIDIPTNTPPATSTLLHWMQTGLTPATTATNLNGTTGVFLLQNTSNTAPFAAYIPPGPPARIPLSHRYVQILVDTSGVQQTALNSLKTAAANRSAFSAINTLTAAGLQTKVVAGNFYNVTNPGPVSNTTTSSNGTRPTTTPVQAGAVGFAPQQSLMALVVIAGGMLLLAW
ncbi:hypothetical protein N0V93_006416 [Gnomoniopsis smithogilvyi]|uniref:PEBP-like protein n=1 Tax=Gnomoniopsis smithogilvyi TaxID=1191159 RepID=A0A9W9CUP9_9PEZI|nr:hypothetical protein N0V93_006416 [Gnomoniopsis smithogilvyi]